jgi:hypothetical protein
MARVTLRSLFRIKSYSPLTLASLALLIFGAAIANHFMAASIYKNSISEFGREFEFKRGYINRDISDLETQMKFMVGPEMTEGTKTFVFEDKKLSLFHSSRPEQKILVNDNGGESFASTLASNTGTKFSIFLKNGTYVSSTKASLTLVDYTIDKFTKLIARDSGRILNQELNYAESFKWGNLLKHNDHILIYKDIPETNLVVFGYAPTSSIMLSILKFISILNGIIILACIALWGIFKHDKSQSDRFNMEVLGFLNYLRFGSLEFQGKFKPTTESQKQVAKAIMDCVYGSAYLKSFIDSDWINKERGTVTPKFFSTLVSDHIEQSEKTPASMYWFMGSVSCSSGQIASAVMESINQIFKSNDLFIYQTSEDHFLFLTNRLHPGKFSEMLRRSLYSINKLNRLLATDISVLSFFFYKKVNVSESALIAQALRSGKLYFTNQDRIRKDQVFELKNYTSGISIKTLTWRETLIEQATITSPPPPTHPVAKVEVATPRQTISTTKTAAPKSSELSRWGGFRQTRDKNLDQ